MTELEIALLGALVDLKGRMAKQNAEVVDLRGRVRELEERNRRTVKVQVLTPEQLVENMKRRRNGDNPYRCTTETPAPEWGVECET